MVKFPFKRSMLVHFAIAVMLPLVVGFSLLMVIIGHILYVKDINAQKEKADMLARQVANILSRNFMDLNMHVDFATQRLSEMNYKSSGTLASVNGILHSLLAARLSNQSAWISLDNTMPEHERFYLSLVRNADGSIQLTKDIPPELLSKNPPNWYAVPMHQGRRFFNVLDNTARGVNARNPLAATMSAPIVHQGKIVGTVGVDMTLSRAYALLETKHNMSSEKFFFLAPDGIIIFSENLDEIGRNLFDFGFPDQEKLKQALVSGQPVLDVLYSPFKQDEALICLYPIAVNDKGNNIFMYFGIPASEIYESASASAMAVLPFGAGGLLFLFACLFFATRSIVKPIKFLTNRFKTIAGGGIDLQTATEMQVHQLRQTGVEEIDILNIALQKMLEEIHTSHALHIKTAETELEKHKVESEAEARTNFFASMSHEIRTPMNAIMGIADIMLSDRTLSPTQSKYIRDIKVSSEALLTIVNDILDLSKLDVGKLSLSPTTFNFKVLLDNICSLVLYLATEKGLSFKFSSAGNLPEALYGDDMRLRQALLNILGNAVKYTLQGEVIFSVVIEESQITFKVADTGIGIKPEDRALLFQPFKQLDTHKNRSIKGTGLGLSISKSLIELMGGTIEVESVYGTGSTFTIRIPKTFGDSSALNRNAGRGTRYSPHTRILLVDDNELNLTVAAGLLKTLHSIKPDMASSGKMAIALLKQTDYHLIFMDHMMPEMDGLEVTLAIRKLGGRFAQVPIIALTANAVAGMKENFIKAGMNDFLSKPVRKTELEEILYRWLPMGLRLPSSEPESAQEDDFSLPLRQILEMEELDMAHGLKMVASPNEYEEILKLLGNKVAILGRQMDDSLTVGNIKDFTIHIHGLRSSLAGVGAAELATMAQSMEKAGLNEDIAYCREHYPEFYHRLDALGSKLREAFSLTEVPTGENNPLGDRETLNKSVAEILDVLAYFDQDAASTALEKLLKLNFGPKINEMLRLAKDSVNAFRYDEAVARLKTLLE